MQLQSFDNWGKKKKDELVSPVQQTQQIQPTEEKRLLPFSDWKEDDSLAPEKKPIRFAETTQYLDKQTQKSLGRNKFLNSVLKVSDFGGKIASEMLTGFGVLGIGALEGATDMIRAVSLTGMKVLKEVYSDDSPMRVLKKEAEQSLKELGIETEKKSKVMSDVNVFLDSYFSEEKMQQATLDTVEFGKTTKKIADNLREKVGFKDSFYYHTLNVIGRIAPQVAASAAKIPYIATAATMAIINAEEAFNVNIEKGISEEEAFRRSMNVAMRDLPGIFILGSFGFRGRFSKQKVTWFDKSGIEIKTLNQKIKTALGRSLQDVSLEIVQETWSQGMFNIATDQPFFTNFGTTAKMTIIPALLFSGYGQYLQRDMRQRAEQFTQDQPIPTEGLPETGTIIQIDKIVQETSDIITRTQEKIDNNNFKDITPEEASLYALTDGEVPFRPEEVQAFIESNEYNPETGEVFIPDMKENIFSTTSIDQELGSILEGFDTVVPETQVELKPFEETPTEKQTPIENQEQKAREIATKQQEQRSKEVETEIKPTEIFKSLGEQNKKTFLESIAKKEGITDIEAFTKIIDDANEANLSIKGQDIIDLLPSVPKLSERDAIVDRVRKSVQPEIKSEKPLDDTTKKVDTLDNDRDRQKTISDTSDISATDDSRRSEETTSEISGYDRATMLVESGDGSTSDRPDVNARIGKKGRQVINEQVETLLNEKDFSIQPSDYTQSEIDLLREYTGAGGKESVGATGEGLLHEYYTPTKVVEGVWDIVNKLIPDAQTAFEPSAGTGRFMEYGPKGISVDGVELSKISGTIAQILNPESNITIGDFQDLFFDRKTNKAKDIQQYDVVVGNPPFGIRGGFLKGKGEESKINRQEEYFIKRGLDMTKEGGYLVYVVNSSFLKTNNSAGKKEISKLGTLEYAFRLPENIFDDTSIGTDIVVFKKEQHSTLEADLANSMIVANEYFNENPQNVLGETKIRKGRFGDTESYVEGNFENAIKKLNKEIAKIKKSEGLHTKETRTEKRKSKEVKERQVTERKKREAIRQELKTERVNNVEVIENQIVTNAKVASDIESLMYQRILRDGNIPNPSSSEIEFLNYQGGKYYPDVLYFSGNVIEKLDVLASEKKKIIDELGEEQYNKQKKGLESIIPSKIPLQNIIFDPMDRHVLNVEIEKGSNATVFSKFTTFLRSEDITLSPGVKKYEVIRYVQGRRFTKESKDKIGSIKTDAKRLFNFFIQKHLDTETQIFLEDDFNRLKNSYVQTDFGSIPVEVQNMAKFFRGEEFKLSETQKNGVGFLVNKGSGLIAYGVGVGKTHTLLIATVANMQKGWTKRPLFVVPKATISDTWINTIEQMFPGITVNNLNGLQVNVVNKLKKQKGENPADWIKDGEISVISHEGILKLGLKESELRKGADDLQDALWKTQKTKRGAEEQGAKIDEIAGNAQKYVTDIMMSDLGIDHISVDEVHNFRKVFQGAKPEDDTQGNVKRFSNVVGGTPSRRAQQLFLLSQYIQKNNENRNVFLASATPFENHATEVYNILSFVARDRMKKMGIFNINDFFSVYSNFKTELDRKLDGTWVPKEKMKSFVNLESLQSLIQEFVDYRQDETLVRPERKILTPHLEMSEKQMENAEEIQQLLKSNEDGATLKASTYSMLNAISPYFIKEYVQTKPTVEQLFKESPKLNFTLEAIKRVRNNEKTKDYGTFVYLGKAGVEYHPMIADYIAQEAGYSKDEVAFISGNIKDSEKEKIKDLFNSGVVKVLVGGDQTKEGIDLQKNGFMTINLALGWNPTETAQVEGRVWRQGNKRNIAPIIFPLVENSGDATIYSKYEEKGGRINDLFSFRGKMFDVGEVDPAEKKISLLTDPRDKATMAVEFEAAQLQQEKIVLEQERSGVVALRANIKQTESSIVGYQNIIDRDTTGGKSDIVIDSRQKISVAKNRLKRLNETKEGLEIDSFEDKLQDLDIQIADVDSSLEQIKDTFKEKLEQFTKERQEQIADRQTINDLMKDVDVLIDEVFERSDAEIAELKAAKIAEMEAKKRASMPEFKIVKSEAEWSNIQQQYVEGKLTLKELVNLIQESRPRIAGSIIEGFITNNIDGLIEYNQVPENAIQNFVETEPNASFKRMSAITIEQEIALERLEKYKKRLKMDFDVNFVNKIFTGETIGGKNGEAYAVTYNNKISLAENVVALAADHEIVHQVLNNWDSLDIFNKDISRYELRKVANDGKDFKSDEISRIDEKIAFEYEDYVKSKESGKPKNILEKFFQKLQEAFRKLFNAFRGKIDVVQDFYRKLYEGEATNDTVLRSFEGLDDLVTLDTKDGQALDFGMLEDFKYKKEQTKADFKKIFDDLEKKDTDFSKSYVKKDINLIQQYLGQSADMYLSDPVEFEAAKDLQEIGDARVMKKETLDQKVTKLLKPYFKLPKKQQAKVDEILVRGDIEAKNFSDSDLRVFKLNDAQIKAYFDIRKAFTDAHDLLIQKMVENNVKPEDIESYRKMRAGYIPHRWFGKYAVKKQTLKEGGNPKTDSDWETQEQDAFKTQKEAHREYEKRRAENKNPKNVRFIEDTLQSVDVDFFSEQRFSFANMKSVISKMKTEDDLKKMFIDNMRDFIKEKGFGRHYIQRKGIKGYDTDNMPQVIAEYFSGLNGYITKMEAANKYFGVLEKIDPRRQKRFYAWARDTIAYDMGNSREFNKLKNIAFIYYLANDLSFLLVNTTQNITVGIGELSKLETGVKKLYNAEIQLAKATADFNSGNITDEERIVIESLLKVGRIGGEFTSELMGFKNNPVFRQQSSAINKALYKTTSFVESNVNRVPAFLAARRIIAKNNPEMSQKELNTKALETSDNIHYRYGKHNKPWVFRGLLGDIFVFNMFTRSYLFQLARDLKQREFVSLFKKLFYSILLGGLQALPLVGLLRLIYNAAKSLFASDDEFEDEETKEELTFWKLALQKGILSAGTNIDFSSRVGVGIMSLEQAFENPLDVRSYSGAIGGLFLNRLPKGLKMLSDGRMLEGFGFLLPDFLGNPLRAIDGYQRGRYTQYNNPLEDGDDVFKYNSYEAFIKAAGLTPLRETLAWEARSDRWKLQDRKTRASSKVRFEITKAINEGQFEKARQIQQDARDKNILDETREYVNNAVKDFMVDQKVNEWNALQQKNSTTLRLFEKQVVANAYGPDATSGQKSNVRKELSFRIHFGYSNKLANDINKASSNAKKVEILLKARETMPASEFKQFFDTGRKTVVYDSGQIGYILISNDVRTMLLEKLK